MTWEKIKHFLKPTSLKLMVFFVLISLYLTITFYQTFQLYSNAAILSLSQVHEVRSAIKECQGNSSCLSQLDLDEIRVTVFNPSFIIPQTIQFVESYNSLETVKTVLYPLSDQLVYDYAITRGFSYVLGDDVRIDLENEVNYARGGTVTPNYQLPIKITFDYAPVYAEGFFFNVTIFVLYFYVLGCIINLIKKIISERIKNRFDIVYH